MGNLHSKKATSLQTLFKATYLSIIPFLKLQDINWIKANPKHHETLAAGQKRHYQILESNLISISENEKAHLIKLQRTQFSI